MASFNDTNSNLSIYYQNVRGLRTKTTDVFRKGCLSSYSIIICTETWLVDSVSNSELLDDRYLVWRRDRNYTLTNQVKGGGVLIATRKDLQVKVLPQLNSTAEDLWLCVRIQQVNTRKWINLYLCVIYLCEQCNGLSFSMQLSNFLAKLNYAVSLNPNDAFLVIGDFNLSNIVWVPKNISSFYPTNINSSDEQVLTDEMYALNLIQFNGVPNKLGRILDLVFSNQNVSVTECLDPLTPTVDSHHPPLLIKLCSLFIPVLDYAPRTRYLYNKGDFTSINNEIQELDWDKRFQGRSVDECVSIFNQTMYDLHSKFIPTKSSRNYSFPIWYSVALKKAIKEKYKYLVKYNRYGNKSDEYTYKLLRDRVNRLEASCYEKYMQLTEDSILENPKLFWTYVKNRSQSHTLPSSMSFNDNIVSTGDTICNAFSTYFQSTFLNSSVANSNSTSVNVSVQSQLVTANNISNIEIDQDKIIKLLKKLDSSKAPGPDYISSKFLIKCASSIAYPIASLFNLSLSTNTVPKLWKSAFITPVHKKGSKTVVTNYRPISKLCIIAKIFERLIYDQVYAALSNYFSPHQHGFLKGKSTVSNLLLLNDYITLAMDSGHQVDVVYTDYSKAFDKIDHYILLQKLTRSGICGDLLRWFSSYIDNRSQAVVLNNYISSWVPVPSGVPQGSLLGPLLFIIYVADIDSCFLSSKLLCFADDMKVFSTVSSADDMIALQADLVRLEEYCRINKLELNPSKCSFITFTRKFNVIPTTYTLQGQALSRYSSMRDLGVIHDSKLLFDEHVEKIVSKASKALGFIMRLSKNFKNVKTFKILYCTFVRSNLEYASEVWNPRYDVYIDRLESIQRRFLKYLCFRVKINYDSSNYLDLCKKFHFLPLKNRRDISDYLYMLKIIKSNIDCPELLSKVQFNIPNRPLRFTPPLHVPLANTNYRQNSFIVRASKVVNEMSKHLDIDPFFTSITGARRNISRNFFNES